MTRRNSAAGALHDHPCFVPIPLAPANAAASRAGTTRAAWPLHRRTSSRVNPAWPSQRGGHRTVPGEGLEPPHRGSPRTGGHVPSDETLHDTGQHGAGNVDSASVAPRRGRRVGRLNTSTTVDWSQPPSRHGRSFAQVGEPRRSGRKTRGSQRDHAYRPSPRKVASGGLSVVFNPSHGRTARCNRSPRSKQGFPSRGYAVHRGSSAKAADLRGFLSRHTKTNGIDADTLARLPLFDRRGLALHRRRRTP
jgi:hypothetical protein